LGLAGIDFNVGQGMLKKIKEHQEVLKGGGKKSMKRETKMKSQGKDLLGSF